MTGLTPASPASKRRGSKTKVSRSKAQSQQALGDLQELREFLKIVKPDWSLVPGQHGHTNVERVLRKLQEIGVRNIAELMQRVDNNTINEDLFHARKAVFAQETLDQFKQRKRFLTNMEYLKEAHYRQEGVFAPVPQLLAKTNRAAAVLRTGGRQWHTDNLPQRKQQQCDGPATGPTLGGCWDDSSPSSADDKDVGDHPCRIPGKRTSSTSAPFDKGTRNSVGISAAEREMVDQPLYHEEPCDVIWMGGDDCADVETNVPMVRPMLRFVTTAGAGSRPRTKEQRGGRCLMRPGPQGTPQRPRSAPHNDSFAQACSTSDVRVVLPARPASSAACRETRRESIAAVPLQEAWAERDDDVLEAYGHRLQQTGEKMQKGCWPAHWAVLKRTSLLAQGEAVMRERQAVDDHMELMKTIRKEGEFSATRRSIAENIKVRLVEEATRELKNPAILDTHMTKANIKDNLSLMQQSRGELTSLRNQAKSVIQPDLDVGIHEFRARFSLIKQFERRPSKSSGASSAGSTYLSAPDRLRAVKAN